MFGGDETQMTNENPWDGEDIERQINN